MNGNRLQGALAVLLTLALAISSSGAVRVSAQDTVPPAGPPAAPEADVPTGFTYQGQLANGGTPVTAFCDMRFSLWDAVAGPNQLGGITTVSNIGVVGGKFTIHLPFSAVLFDGRAVWLEIAVRCPAGSGGFSTLVPRQPLTAAPYALGLKPGAAIDGNLTTELFGAHNTGSGEGLNGFSQAGVGVRGESDTSAGVSGHSETNIGVAGLSDSGHGVAGSTGDLTGVFAGVAAFGAGSSTQSIALRIAAGGIEVGGAGINSDTPVLIHQVITGGGGNVCTGGSWASVIDYPLINGNAGAILIVTPNNGPYTGGTTPLNSVPAVFYDNTNFCGHGIGKWVVYNLSLIALPNTAMYNVLVVVP